MSGISSIFNEIITNNNFKNEYLGFWNKTTNTLHNDYMPAEVVVNATDAPTGHVLLCNVPALLYFVHEAGKGRGAPDAAVFQQADKGRLRVVRLQFADVHAGLQFIILYAGIGGNRLQQSPAIGRVIGSGIFGIVSGDNAPARKLGAFHGVPVFPSFGSGYAGGHRLS